MGLKLDHIDMGNTEAATAALILFSEAAERAVAAIEALGKAQHGGVTFVSAGDVAKLDVKPAHEAQDFDPLAGFCPICHALILSRQMLGGMAAPTYTCANDHEFEGHPLDAVSPPSTKYTISGLALAAIVDAVKLAIRADRVRRGVAI